MNPALPADRAGSGRLLAAPKHGARPGGGPRAAPPARMPCSLTFLRARCDGDQQFGAYSLERTSARP